MEGPEFIGRPLEVSGECMRPLLAPGDLVRLERVPAAALRPGDLVALLYDQARPGLPATVAVHRLIWKRRAGDAWQLWTKGDAEARFDSRLTGSAVVGRVIEVAQGRRAWRRLEADSWAPARALWGALAFLRPARSLGSMAASRAVAAAYSGLKGTGPAPRALRSWLLRLWLEAWG